MEWEQTEHGVKNVAILGHRGHLIRVVTGYEIGSDSWPIHVYITPPRGQERKLDGWRARASTMDEGFAAGFREGVRAIDAGDIT